MNFIFMCKVSAIMEFELKQKITKATDLDLVLATDRWDH
jgi:hypothetical protein